MEWKDTLNTLLSVVVGAGITGVGAMWKAQKERKAVAAKALTELLDVRNALVATEGVLRIVLKLGEIPADQVSHLRAAIESIIPRDEGLSERYNQVLSELAAYAPILAYSLRSKDKVVDWLSELRSRAVSGGADTLQFERMESEIRAQALPALDTAILQVARLHGLLTRYRVRRHVLPTADREAAAEALMRKAARDMGLLKD